MIFSPIPSSNNNNIDINYPSEQQFPFIQQSHSSLNNNHQNKAAATETAISVVPWSLVSITSQISSLLSKYPHLLQSPSNQIPVENKDQDVAKDEVSLEEQRKQGAAYGGANIDPKHLGGFLQNDSDTYERELWDWIIDTFDIHSVLDIGCGIGCSTIYFARHPQIGYQNSLCIEGSIDAVKHSLIPNITVQHDYTLGAYWPGREFDMVWSAEFLEHVAEPYMDYYMSTFKKAKILFVTHSEWGGWHHINVHKSEWWIYQFEKYGFQYQPEITALAREMCPLLGVDFKYSYHDLHTDGNRKNSHFHFRGQVYFNKLYLNQLTSYDKLLLDVYRGQSQTKTN